MYSNIWHLSRTYVLKLRLNDTRLESVRKRVVFCDRVNDWIEAHTTLSLWKSIIFFPLYNYTPPYVGLSHTILVKHHKEWGCSVTKYYKFQGQWVLLQWVLFSLVFLRKLFSPDKLVSIQIDYYFWSLRNYCSLKYYQHTWKLFSFGSVNYSKKNKINTYIWTLPFSFATLTCSAIYFMFGAIIHFYVENKRAVQKREY